jgi:hypothetical protein
MPITIVEAIKLIEKQLFDSDDGERGVVFYGSAEPMALTTIGRIRLRRILIELKESPDA